MKKKKIKPKRTKNRFEESILEALEKAELNVKYESSKLSYLISGHYTPDFTIISPSGHIIFLETKGYFRPDAKRKMAAVKKLHPTVDLRILFYAYRENDVKWAVKNSIQYAVGSIPSEWLLEMQL